MRTGSRIGIKLTRSDGSTELYVLDKRVPHDTDHEALGSLAQELGGEILEELARQDPLEVMRVEVVEISLSLDCHHPSRRNGWHETYIGDGRRWPKGEHCRACGAVEDGR